MSVKPKEIFICILLYLKLRLFGIKEWQRYELQRYAKRHRKWYCLPSMESTIPAYAQNV